MSMKVKLEFLSVFLSLFSLFLILEAGACASDDRRNYPVKEYKEYKFGSEENYLALKDRFDRWVFGGNDNAVLKKKGGTDLKVYASRSFPRNLKREQTLSFPTTRLLVFSNTGLKMEAPNTADEADIHLVFVRNMQEAKEFVTDTTLQDFGLQGLPDEAFFSQEECLLYNREQKLEITRTLAFIRVEDWEIEGNEFSLPTIACNFKAIIYHFGALNIQNIADDEVVSPYIEFDGKIIPHIQYHSILKRLYIYEYSLGASREEIFQILEQEQEKVRISKRKLEEFRNREK